MIVVPLGEAFSTDRLLGHLLGIASFGERQFFIAMRPSLEEFDGRIVDCALVLKINARVKALRLIGPELVGSVQTYGE